MAWAIAAAGMAWAGSRLMYVAQRKRDNRTPDPPPTPQSRELDTLDTLKFHLQEVTIGAASLEIGSYFYEIIMSGSPSLWGHPAVVPLRIILLSEREASPSIFLLRLLWENSLSWAPDDVPQLPDIHFPQEMVDGCRRRLSRC
jgi:hypothetical protein